MGRDGDNSRRVPPEGENKHRGEADGKVAVSYAVRSGFESHGRDTVHQNPRLGYSGRMARTGTLRRTKLERRYYDRRDDDERRKLPEEKLVKKILVTGDRNWDDITTVVETLKNYPPGTTLVHGACRGADIICAAVAEALGFVVKAYPADWTQFKRAAGPIRNQQMIDVESSEESPIDVCLAFHNDIYQSHGTADMLDRVIKKDIPFKLVTSPPRSSAD